MKSNQRNRFNARHNGSARNTSRPFTIYRNTSLESTGPSGKLRGTALQLHEKYIAAAKDALIQNDDVLAETCFQYADHYMHLQNQAIANEQVLHFQQIKEAAAAQEAKTASSDSSSSNDNTSSSLDSSLKVVDLSVPVEAINQQSDLHQETQAPSPKATKRFPRKSLTLEKKEPEIIQK